MVGDINHQIRLAARPVGLPKRSDWEFTQTPLPEPRDGEVLARVLYLSLDPAMRGWMNEGRSYIAPVAIGDVMRAGAVGKVVASKHPKFAAGDYVSGGLGVQEYAALDGAQLTKVDHSLAPLPTFLNTLGMPGMTAYFGLLDVGAPKEGDTVVVSGAAGAVGATVGQIAKIKGCRAVGIAGGIAKCRYLIDELGFDAAIDYKTGDLRKNLRAHCPNGVNVYFDNVGGDILDTVLAHARASCPRRGVRSNLTIQQHDADQGAEQLYVAPRQPRADGGHGRVRLCVSVSARDQRYRQLDRSGQAQIPRRRRRGTGEFSRNSVEAVQRREFRQAGA